MLALQFHLEVEADMFEQWLIGHAHEIGHSENIDARMLREQARLCFTEIENVGTEMFSQWIDGIYTINQL